MTSIYIIIVIFLVLSGITLYRLLFKKKGISNSIDSEGYLKHDYKEKECPIGQCDGSGKIKLHRAFKEPKIVRCKCRKFL